MLRVRQGGDGGWGGQRARQGDGGGRCGLLEGVRKWGRLPSGK